MHDFLDHAFRDAGRIELRHQIGDRWISGLFDNADALRLEIRQRADAGNLYTSINAPRLLKASNTMGSKALTDADIAYVVRLPFDFDPVRPSGCPSTDAEMADAVVARDRLVSALLALGWPMPATASSGNGAHSIFRCRMPATPEVRDMLRSLYIGLKGDFSTDSVVFDSTVRNPARIWRLYGSINRKGHHTLDRPHRTAVARIPGRWEAVSPRQVEALAASYARRPTATVRPAPARVYGGGDYSTLNIAAPD